MSRYPTLTASLTCLIILFLVQLSGAQGLIGSFPPEGGRITLEPAAGPIETHGVDFTSPNNGLSNTDDAAPFAFFLTGNDKTNVSRVTLGALGPITIDGPVALNVSAQRDSIVRASYGMGVTPVEFPILNSNQLGLAFSFPYDGGPITLRGIEPGNPVATRGLDFTAEQGSFSSGASPAPYETLLENTPQRWAVNSSTDVIIDGSLTLDVMASSDAQIVGRVEGRTESRSLSVLRAAPLWVDDIESTTPSAGGPITIRPNSGAVTLRSLGVTAFDGRLDSSGNAARSNGSLQLRRRNGKSTRRKT